MKEQSPPKWIGRFFRWFCNPEILEILEGDLIEQYQKNIRKLGTMRANLLYFWNVLLFFQPFAIRRKSRLNSKITTMDMYGNYLKIAWRNLSKHKSYSLINTLGLSIGMTCCILILLWVQHELSYDTFHTKADSIYRIESELQFANGPTIWPIAPAQLAPALRQDFPEVENAVRMSHSRKILVTQAEKTLYETRFYSVSPSIFEVFSFSFIQGSPGSSFVDPSSVIITEEIAEKYFGFENPVGQTFEINKEHQLTVTGVIKSLPDNSHIKMDFIVPFAFTKVLGETLNDWGRFDFPTYVLLEGGVSQEEFELKIEHYLQKHNQDSDTRLLLTPLKRIHLYSASGTGDITNVYLFSFIGLVILCVACINFVNLSTARSVQRAKEVGIRKVVGARKSDLIQQLMSESFLLAFLAFMVAILLSTSFLPLFNEISGKQLEFSAILNNMAIFGLLIILFVSSIFSGVYPAFYISSFHPISVLKGSVKRGMKDSLVRKVLVTIQFSVSIILIISAIVIRSQIDFIRSKKLGFDKEHIVYVNLNAGIREKIDVLKSELHKNPDVIGVAAADRVPVNQGNFTTINRWEGKNSDDALIFNVMSIDEAYLDLLGLKVIQGKKFMEGLSDNGIIVNEEAVRQMGMDSPLGKTLHYWSESAEISGVINDYHFKPLHQAISPLIITNDPTRFRVLFMKLSPGNIVETLDQLQKEFSQIAPDYPFEYYFLDERIDSLYRTEKQTALAISSFTFLTIFTSCLGLFGLATFVAQNRTKEIGIRKVLGAPTLKIVSMLSSQFAKLILLGNVVALPIAYFVMDSWLQNYAYRINIGIWTFFLSTIIVLSIAMLTVSFQSIKVAISNPVDSLRNE